jgi:hypothetical protein
MDPQSEDVKEGIIGRKFVKILSLKISHEIFRTSFQEITEEKLPRKALKLDFDIDDGVFNKIVGEDPHKLYHKMVKITNHQQNIQYNSPLSF